GEAFDEALGRFCEDEQADRLRLLATYGADGLRRMLTRVYETLRSAGRELVLELGERPALAERADELRGAARCPVDDPGATETQRANAGRVLELLTGELRADALVDLSPHRAQGERAAGYEDARRATEQAALDELAALDRGLL